MSEQTKVVAPELDQIAESVNKKIQESKKTDAQSTDDAATINQTTQKQEKILDTKPAPIYFAGKKFETQEDLIKYTSQLESQVKSMQTQNTTQTTATKTTKKVSDLLFEDPDAAVEQIKNDFREEQAQREQQQRAQAESWDKFFKQFPDLKEEKELVDFVMQRNLNELSKLHADQAIAQLGEKTREVIGRYKSKPSGGKELPSGPAMTGPNGTQQTQRVEADRKVVSFVDQVRGLQGKKKIS